MADNFKEMDASLNKYAGRVMCTYVHICERNTAGNYCCDKIVAK